MSIILVQRAKIVMLAWWNSRLCHDLMVLWDAPSAQHGITIACVMSGHYQRLPCVERCVL